MKLRLLTRNTAPDALAKRCGQLNLFNINSFPVLACKGNCCMSSARRSLICIGIVNITTAFCLPAIIAAADDENRIRPCAENPWVWEYQGEPILLIGGSDDDNLFQWPHVVEHLELLEAAGGNYLRNTMSDRPDKGFEVYPFEQLDDGRYDLSRFNEEYWDRFALFLEETHERGIIVQIEVWDRFDYTDVREPNWDRHPYNPKNNVNYTAEESGLPLASPNHPGANDQPFFFTVPELDDNQVVLPFQLAQVDRMLKLSLPYPHVLYCMDNETNGREEWSRFWADHIHQRAEEAGVTVQLTEMWDAWNPLADEHFRTYDHPDIFSFVDVSQNNHNTGDEHWENLLRVRERLSEHPRPMNTVKIYGADGGRFGSSRDGAERFWRNIIGGIAATRFHRPDSGLGLSEEAQAHIRSARMLADHVPLMTFAADADYSLLTDRDENEAFATSAPDGETVVVYFPDGGSVGLKLPEGEQTYGIAWLNIAESEWSETAHGISGDDVELNAPGEGHWVCVVKRD